MAIIETELTATAKTGTLSDFKNLSLLQHLATTELDDGRKVDLSVSLTGMNFEISIVGEPRIMKINVQDMLLKAVEILGKQTTE